MGVLNSDTKTDYKKDGSVGPTEEKKGKGREDNVKEGKLQTGECKS